MLDSIKSIQDERVKVALMGVGKGFNDLKRLFEKNEVDIVDLQSVWSSDNTLEEKDVEFRSIMSQVDCLVNYYTGAFFWAKASYAKLLGVPVVTCWVGKDVDNVLFGYSGLLGHEMIDYHFGLTNEIVDVLHSYGVKLKKIEDEDVKVLVDWLKKKKMDDMEEL